mgnify:CR=1 FL=1
MDRSIIDAFASVLGSRVVTLLVGLITTPILYRELGPSAFGIYAFVLSVFSILMIFVSSGVTEGVRKFLAEERDRPTWKRSVVGFYLRLATALALVGAAIVALAASTGLISRFFGSEFTPYFYVLSVLVIVAQFREVGRRILMGFGLERYSEPLHAGNRILFTVLVLPLVFLGYGVMGVLVGTVAANVVIVVVSLALIHREVPLTAVFRSIPDSFPRRSVLSFNTLSVLLIFLMMSLYHVDILLLQWFRESTQVGHYKAALKVAEFAWFVPMAIQTVFVHSMSNLWSNGQSERVSRIATQVTRYTLLLAALMALGMIALADVAVPVYFGEAATPAIEPLLILLPGAVGFAVARPILAVSQGKGELGYPIVATGIAAVANVLLNLVLVPRYGMNGAAAATSVGYGSMFVLHVWSARNIGFDPLSDVRLTRIVLTIGLAAGPILLLPGLIGRPWIALVIVPPLGAAIYGAFAFLTGALDVGEVVDILAQTPLAGYAASLQRHVATDGGENRE